MDTLEWTTRDKLADWGAGPWAGEPDKVQWQDEQTSLVCLAVRGRVGAWCGYVGVGEGHPAFEVAYDSVDVEVHGGLTFSSFCREEGSMAERICHVPGPGEPDRVWWLGFDCAHAGDLLPGMAKRTGLPEHGTYRNLDYVRAQCCLLADQLAAIEAWADE